MIKPIEYDGITWRMRFEYIPRREACKAQGGPTGTICRILSMGIQITQGESLPMGVKIPLPIWAERNRNQKEINNNGIRSGVYA